MRRIFQLIIVALCAMAASGRNDWYDTPLTIAPGEEIIAIPDTATVATANVHLRFAAKTDVALMWDYTDAAHCMRATYIHPKSSYDDIYTQRATLKVERLGANGAETVCEKTFGRIPSFMSIKLVYDGVSCRLYCGEDTQELIGIVDFNASAPGAVVAYSHSGIAAKRITAEFTYLPAPAFAAFATTDDLVSHISSSSDRAEGFWRYLDRDMRPDKAALGGSYTLATVRNQAGGYDIVFIDGADVNVSSWQPLRIKGHLRPTIFVGNFDMDWIEAGGQIIDRELSAQLSDDGAILSLRFPLYGATLRFSRVSLYQ